MSILLVLEMKPFRLRLPVPVSLVLELELTQVGVTSMGCQLIHFLLMLASDSEFGELARLFLVVLIPEDSSVQ